MGLKIATFEFVNQYGGREQALLAWKGAEINYGFDGWIRFAVFENEAERQRNNPKSVLAMPITAADVLAMFQRTGNVALEISDASWDPALATKFIPSRVEDPESGEVTMQAFSLADLDALIVDVGVPEDFK